MKKKLKVEAMLLEIGFNPSLMGFSFLVDAIITYKSGMRMNNLYNEISKKTAFPASIIDRNIRTAIKGNDNNLQNNQTNSRFIALMSHKLNVLESEWKE